MNQQQNQLEQLAEIRAMMERSTRFISLSGLSGVGAGLAALLGAFVFLAYFDFNLDFSDNIQLIVNWRGQLKPEFLTLLFGDAVGVLILALGSGWYFTQRRAKKLGTKVVNSVSIRLVINLMIPLIVGGLFCLILMYHGIIYMVAPATLIFYGLALINGSKYTFEDIRYLGIAEILVGLLSAVFVGYGFYFWVIGFGILHIIYGIVMYLKFEKTK